jgi:hypothetical protein
MAAGSNIARGALFSAKIVDSPHYFSVRFDGHRLFAPGKSGTLRLTKYYAHEVIYVVTPMDRAAGV